MEILGALERETGALGERGIERAATRKTLREIIELMTTAPPSTAATTTLTVAGTASETTLPLVGVIESRTEDAVTVTRVLDLATDLFLLDHTLGGAVSSEDPTLTALPLVPLTMTIELMAEVGSLLSRGEVVSELREVYGHRWIAMRKSRVTLRVEAQRVSLNTVAVRAYEPPKTAPDTVIAEATVVFARTPPPAPFSEPLNGVGARPSACAGWLYAERTFHGPCFQGVATIDGVAQDGIEATLEVRSADGLFRDIAAPRFLTHPVLLDAAGQLLGFWTMERLATGFYVFPFHVEAVQLFATAPPAGGRVRARACILQLEERRVRADIDVVMDDGSCLARLVGWEDRRLEVPSTLHRFRIAPRETMLCEAWPDAVAALATTHPMGCCGLTVVTPGLLEGQGRFWELALAHLELGTRERAAWEASRPRGAAGSGCSAGAVRKTPSVCLPTPAVCLVPFRRTWRSTWMREAGQ